MSELTRVVVVGSALLAGIMLVELYRWSRRQGEPYEILSIVTGVTLGMEFVVRPIAVATSSQVGWDPSTFRQLTESDNAVVQQASLLSAACVLVFALLLRVSRSLARGGSHQAIVQSQPGNREKKTWRVPDAAILWLCAAVTLMVGLTYGRFGAAFGGEYGRSNFGSGYLYALVDLAFIAVLVTISTLDRARMRTPAVRAALLGALLVAVSVHVFILGGRVEFLAISVAALTIWRSRFGRPRGRTLLIGMAVLVLASGVYRVATREVYYPENLGKSAGRLVIESLRNPLALVTRGDVSSYDKLVEIRRRELPVAPGQTYRAAVLGQLPESIAGDSGEGGNRTFTRLYLPERYAQAKTSEGVSLAGEGLMNYGPLGALAAFAAVGTLLGALAERAQRRRRWLVIGLAIGVFPSVVRADAYNTLSLLGAFGFAAILVFAQRLIMGVSPRGQSRRAGYQRESASATSVTGGPAAP